MSTELGVVMLLYLRNAWKHHLAANPHVEGDELNAAICEGTVMRVRPIAIKFTIAHGTLTRIATMK